MPTALSTLAVTVFILLFVDTDKPRHGKYRAPETDVLVITSVFPIANARINVFYIGNSLVQCHDALGFFTHRHLNLPVRYLAPSLPSSHSACFSSITTPHKLSYFGLMPSLRILLTPTERRRPWILYLTPGLMAAELLHISVVVLGLGPLRRLMLPNLSKPDLTWADLSIPKMVIYLVIVALSTAALSPLEVIATRLAIQRNHASSEYNSVSQEVEGDNDESAEFAGVDEDVIGSVNTDLTCLLQNANTIIGYDTRQILISV